jgi:hypothetical protein
MILNSAGGAVIPALYGFTGREDEQIGCSTVQGTAVGMSRRDELIDKLNWVKFRTEKVR